METERRSFVPPRMTSAHTFRALLWKESLEISLHGLAVLILMGAMFLLSVVDPASIDGVTNPTGHFEWFDYVGAIAAATVGFLQARREAKADMWALAIHRPASGAQIFGAKVITGLVVLTLAMLVPYIAAMAWIATPGHVAVPFDRSFWLTGIADFLSSVTFYAGGLYAGSHRRRRTTRLLGIGFAIVSMVLVSGSRDFWVAIMMGVACTVVLVAAAWSDFMSGSDFDAQPSWGRAANVAIGIPALAMVLLFVLIAGGQARWKSDQQASARVQGSVLGNGRIVRVEMGAEVEAGTGDRDVKSATDLWGTTWVSVNRGNLSENVIFTDVLPTNPEGANAAQRDSYRDLTKWVMRVFPGEPVPAWYFERRSGLISIYDDASRRQLGWLGPDGYTEGSAKPAKRFDGHLQTMSRFDRRENAVMVLSGGVYQLRNLERPRLLFPAPEGETILHLSEGRLLRGMQPRANAAWGWFRAITTDKKTYVIDTAGTVQASVPHPRGAGSRNVVVYRAPYAMQGPATFIWYGPAAGGGDSLSRVFEFRHAFPASRMVESHLAAPPMRRSPGGEPNVFRSSGDEVSVVETLGSIPVFQAVAVFGAGRGTERAEGMRASWTALLVGLVLAMFTFWLCRRHAFSRGRTATWTVLAALFGPIAPVLMWMLVEWPAREACPGCRKSRVVSRERCEHCDAPFAVPPAGMGQAYGTASPVFQGAP